MNNYFKKEMVDLLNKKIPENLIKVLPSNGMKLNYISGSTVIDMLNNIFDYMWSWEITDQWIEEGKEKGRGKFVAHVTGVLTIHLIGENNEIFNLKKMASGSKVVIGGINQQDSIFKSAGTDALKKAASLVGIGLELWRDEDEEDFLIENKLNKNFSLAWTDSNKKEYSEELIKLSSFSKEYGVQKITSELSKYTKGAASDMREVLPDNIRGFISHLTKVYGDDE